ncbi:MAG TPA: PilZ domain-containing protein [Nitrospira sp.]|nr:PilZ domain-containing protein [Nitrospira sp.]
MERRRYRRVPVQLEGVFLGNAHEVEGKTIDVSLGGAKLQSELKVHPGKVILIRLRFPGVEEPISVEEALVRWVGDRHVGVEFQNLNSAELDELEQLIDELDDAEGTGRA